MAGIDAVAVEFMNCVESTCSLAAGELVPIPTFVPSNVNPAELASVPVPLA
jgi:hypothetical protein